MLKKLWARFFGVEGAALTSKRIAFFYDVYAENDGWYFSWRSENGGQGALLGPFATWHDASLVLAGWRRGLAPGSIAVKG